MTFADRYLLVRAASLYFTVALTVLVLLWRRPSRRAVVSAGLGVAWNVPALLAFHLIAIRVGWWRYDAAGGLLLGIPIDLLLAWAWLWGFAATIAFPALPLAAVAAIALVVDAALMPHTRPVIQLGPQWLLGDAAAIGVCLVPGALLARWTRDRRHLAGRAILQVVAFSGLITFIIPAVAIEGSGGSWTNPLRYPAWQLSLIVQILAVPALLGLSAVQEFVERGGGTPVPFDPPGRLVTSGIYAYVRNPMQLSAVLLLVAGGLVLGNPWISAASVMAHVYAIGLAGWDEDEDLRARFGDAWALYRKGVRAWIPRLRPWRDAAQPPSRLYVAAACDMCQEVGRWFDRHHARHLVVLPAESHPMVLTRITYEAGDGSPSQRGVAAIARALEHVHVGWALIGCALRVPIVRPLVRSSWSTRPGAVPAC